MGGKKTGDLYTERLVYIPAKSGMEFEHANTGWIDALGLQEHPAGSLAELPSSTPQSKLLFLLPQRCIT